MHRQQAMPAARTHTPRTPPHACNSCPLTSTACAHARTHTRTHSAPPGPRIRSHHTSAAPATRPTGPRVSKDGLLLAHPTRARLVHAGCSGQAIVHQAPVDLLEVVVPLQGPQLPHRRKHALSPWLACRHR
jgi:hypothetical protein